MSTSAPDPGERIRSVRVTPSKLAVRLADGREITVPLDWFPRLLRATPAQRRRWEIDTGGFGIRWPEIDEDLSTSGLLRGQPAPARARRG